MEQAMTMLNLKTFERWNKSLKGTREARQQHGSQRERTKQVCNGIPYVDEKELKNTILCPISSARSIQFECSRKCKGKKKDSTNSDTLWFATRQTDQFIQSTATEQISAQIDRPRRKWEEEQKIS